MASFPLPSARPGVLPFQRWDGGSSINSQAKRLYISPWDAVDGRQGTTLSRVQYQSSPLEELQDGVELGLDGPPRASQQADVICIGHGTHRRPVAELVSLSLFQHWKDTLQDQVKEERTEGTALLDALQHWDVAGVARPCPDLLCGTRVDLLTDGDEVLWDTQPCHHVPHGGVWDGAKGVLHVQPQHSDIFLPPFAVLEGTLHHEGVLHAAFKGQESLLCAGELLLRDGPHRQPLCQDSSVDLVEGSLQGDGPPVCRVAYSPFFVDEHCVTAFPRHGNPSIEEADVKQVSQLSIVHVLPDVVWNTVWTRAGLGW